MDGILLERFTASTLSAAIDCQPSSGTVPFDTVMSVGLHNLTRDLIRRFAGKLNVKLAGGLSISSWRAGKALTSEINLPAKKILEHENLLFVPWTVVTSKAVLARVHPGLRISLYERYPVPGDVKIGEDGIHLEFDPEAAPAG